MKRSRLLGLILLSSLIIIGCGKKEEIRQAIKEKKEALSSEGRSKVETKTEIESEKTGEDIKASKKETEIRTETWVTEAEFSKNETYSYPHINEEVFGETAKNFNRNTSAYHEASKPFLEMEDGGIFRETVSYETYKDKVSNTYSLVAKNLTLNGELMYRTFVVDLESKEEVSFEEALNRSGYSLLELKEEVGQLFGTLYSEASYLGLIEGDVDLEIEDYVDERLHYFEKSLKNPPPSEINPTLFSLEDGKLSLYLMIREPGGGRFYYRPYQARKNLIERAVLNQNDTSLLALLNLPSDTEELKEAEIVKGVATEATGEKYYFVSMRDGVKVRIVSITFSESTEDFSDGEEVYQGELKKGEIIALDTVIPEGLPNLRLEAEADGLRYESELSYNGRFAPPKIEYLDGE